jgi:hypothetical protein
MNMQRDMRVGLIKMSMFRSVGTVCGLTANSHLPCQIFVNERYIQEKTGTDGMDFAVFCLSVRYVITYEHRLTEFENRMRNSIFGCGRKEITRGDRKSLLGNYIMCTYH